MGGASPPRAPATLLVGPGPRLARLLPLIKAARAADAPALRRIDDLDALLAPPGERGVALLDAEGVRADDLGFVRRLLERHAAWSVVLVGGDPHGAAATGLRPSPRVRWLPWPLDVETLSALVRSPAPGPLAPLEAEDAELRAVEAVLSGREPAPPAPPPPPRTEPRATAPSAVDGAAPPAYFRDQVADLADVAQRIDLSLRALLEDSEGAPDDALDDERSVAPGLEALAGEVGRLVQFTRTLGYLAAPPNRGEQVFSLSTLLEELLKTVARAGPDAPRYLYRGPGELEVRSDKRLLVQAFDALLQLAGSCASRGEVVRVAAREAGADPDGPPEVEVEIAFPAGPLRGLEPSALLRPYALRRELPGIGPNALAAAAGILRGQGGGLAVLGDADGGLRCVARLPGTGVPGRSNGSG